MYVKLLIYYIDRRHIDATLLLAPDQSCVVRYHKPYDSTRLRSRIEPLAELYRLGSTWQDVISACAPKKFARVAIEFLDHSATME